MVHVQIVIANTRRHYFSTEAENDYTTDFFFSPILNSSSCPIPIKKQKSAVCETSNYTFLWCTKQGKEKGRGGLLI